MNRPNNIPPEELFKTVGHIRFHGAITQPKVQGFLSGLQQLMNEYRVVKIDLALSPFEKGPMIVDNIGPEINLN